MPKLKNLEILISIIIIIFFFLFIVLYIFGFQTIPSDIGSPLPTSEDRLEEVSQRPGNFEFLRRDITVRRGKEIKLYTKFENPLEGEVQIFKGGTIPKNESTFSLRIVDPIENYNNQDFEVFMPALSLSGFETRTSIINLNTSSEVPLGHYFFVFKIEFDNGTNQEEFERTITVSVVE